MTLALKVIVPPGVPVLQLAIPVTKSVITCGKRLSPADVPQPPATVTVADRSIPLNVESILACDFSRSGGDVRGPGHRGGSV